MKAGPLENIDVPHNIVDNQSSFLAQNILLPFLLILLIMQSCECLKQAALYKGHERFNEYN
jgi:hypothetical protein